MSDRQPMHMFYTSFRLEAIGDDLFDGLSRLRRNPDSPAANRFLRRAIHHPARCRAWIARLTGTDDRYGFAREFVHGHRDYLHANSTGSRGVFIYYALEPGLYEVNEPISFRKDRRYFLRCHMGQSEEISREDVIACLTT